jgi:beta-glucanase (GH16 family)
MSRTIKIILLLSLQSSPLFAAWQMVWADSFSVNGLPDPTKWSYQVGNSGWGNSESQYYSANRSENARVEDGNLIIEARRDFLNNQYEYTSARIRSINKGDWTYGRFEIRAKLPKGNGTWPAIWMMPTVSSYGGWPSSGEIDIMEHVGKDPGNIHFSNHSIKFYWKVGTQKEAITKIADCSSAFHVYSMEWYADSIFGYVDSTRYFKNYNDHSGWQAWPFDKPFHLILNIAIGGAWGGAIDNAIFPQQMLIDYAKVYTWINSTPVIDRRLGAQKVQPRCLLRQARDDLHIAMPRSGPYAVQMFGIDGKVVASATGTGATGSLNLTNAPPGVYAVQASGKWGVWKQSVTVLR